MSPMPRRSQASGPGAIDHGIGCEKCHGPGENHILAVKAELSRPGDHRSADGLGLARGRVVRRVPQPAPRKCLAERSIRGSLSGDDADLEPMFSREPGQARLHHLPRPASQRGDIRRRITRPSACRAIPAAARARQMHSAAKTTSLSEAPSRRVPGQSVQRMHHLPHASVKKVVPHSSFTDHFIRVHRD